MAYATATPIAPRIRPLFPDLDLCSPSLPQSPQHDLHFTVPRLRRGPMYSVYSELRESKLRKKMEGSIPLRLSMKTLTTPEKKSAAVPSVVRSISDFSPALRKENRKPEAWASPAPTKASKLLGVTPRRPPPATVVASSKRERVGMPTRTTGSASSCGRDDKSCVVRKSYSCLRELKGLSGATPSALELEGRAPGDGGMVARRLTRRYH